VAALQGIARSDEAKREASVIAAAISATWDNNAKSDWWLWAGSQKIKGYFCYEWAYAFEDAFDLVFSGEFFTASVQFYGNVESEKVHAFLEITSVETKKSIYVDDGFFRDGHVHTEKPIDDHYRTRFEFNPHRGLCDVPRAYPGPPSPKAP